MLSCFSHVWLFGTLWTVAHQAPLSMWFSSEVYWSGLPCPSPGNLPEPGIKLISLLSPALACGFFTTSATWEAQRGVECMWETGIDIHTLLCIKQITNENLLYNTRNYLMFSADLNGMGIWKIRNTCICVADSLHCIARNTHTCTHTHTHNCKTTTLIKNFFKALWFRTNAG